ncbi:MAG: type II secretion system protein [Candidatus Pacebacteria bacterium]|nr:type II secretion system protein [Candidatus Paceibacterota bacterium]
MIKKIQIKNGFTLIEALVAIGLFSIVISTVVGIFINGSVSQKRTIELYTVQREAGYLMETMSRELKMAIGIDDSQENSSDHIIEFTNYDDVLTEYCRSDASGSCDAGGKYISRNGERISSSSIAINNLVFYTPEDFSDKQPMVTIVMNIESEGQYGADILLQNSVVTRIYE